MTTRDAPISVVKNVQDPVSTAAAEVARGLDVDPEQGSAILAGTMLLTTLSFFHLFGAFLSRDQVNTIFDRSAIPGALQLRRYGIALLVIRRRTP